VDEDFSLSIQRLTETVASSKVLCSIEFSVDLAELEATIRELEIELEINRMRIENWIANTPIEDRRAIYELLEKQVF